ncbi:hypothetical protein BGW80DRAFT_1260524 [Lactifluus volemus]|nr:hypothetical protein BGW80DRAFT_1260524 [Lactifluus volemus]
MAMPVASASLCHQGLPLALARVAPLFLWVPHFLQPLSLTARRDILLHILCHHHHLCPSHLHHIDVLGVRIALAAPLRPPESLTPATSCPSHVDILHPPISNVGRHHSQDDELQVWLRQQTAAPTNAREDNGYNKWEGR